MPPDTIAQPDLVIRDAFLIDGSGKPGARGDLAVKDDRIVAMGDLAKLKGAREIAANGLALAPGFVDTHTHDDRALLSNPLMECKISQGVTTVITGNCASASRRCRSTAIRRRSTSSGGSRAVFRKLAICRR